MTDAAGVETRKPPIWDFPLVEMVWDLTGVYANDPGQLSGAALANATRTYEYNTVPGSQIIFYTQYRVGAGTTITNITLIPECRVDLPTDFYTSSVLAPASKLASTFTPCSYINGANAALNASTGTPFTPLVLRYDAIQLPLDIVLSGSNNGVVSTGFFYPPMGNKFRFQIFVAGGPGAAGDPTDNLQIFMARGALRSNSATNTV